MDIGTDVPTQEPQYVPQNSKSVGWPRNDSRLVMPSALSIGWLKANSGTLPTLAVSCAGAGAAHMATPTTAVASSGTRRMENSGTGSRRVAPRGASLHRASYQCPAGRCRVRTGAPATRHALASCPRRPARVGRVSERAADYDYDVPPGAVAQVPAARREAARLLLVPRGAAERGAAPGWLRDAAIRDL